MSRRRMAPAVLGSLAMVAVIAGTLAPATATAAAAVTAVRATGLHSVRVDASSTVPKRGSSFPASISDDGSVVAMTSDAPDLVPGDTNGKLDAFVWVSGQGVRRIGVTDTGEQFARGSYRPLVDGPGRSVVFGAGLWWSASTNLIGVTDDRSTRVRMLPHLLTRGRLDYGYVVAVSDGARVLLSQTSQGDGDWSQAVVTVDGHPVALSPDVETQALGLSRDGSIALVDRFAAPWSGLNPAHRLRWLDTSHPGRLLDVPLPQGCDWHDDGPPLLSADGHRVLIDCEKINTPGAYEIDLTTGRSTLVRPGTRVDIEAQSADGRYYVVFTADALTPADTNRSLDAYVVDRQHLGARLVSVDERGRAATVGRVVMSGDGSTIAFTPRTHQGVYVVHLETTTGR